MLPIDLTQVLQQRIGLVGWGVNHQAVARWLRAHGAHRLMILDEATDLSPPTDLDVPWRFGPDAFEQLTDYDLILRSPGIPLDHPKLSAAQAAGVQVSSQTRLFFSLCPARIIGVTGTKGKGTTASLIATMLEEEGKKPAARGQGFGLAYLAGNIGRDPFVFLDELTADDWVVLELSSFQLEDLDESPHVAVVLTVGEDHLNRHQSVDAYVAAKRHLVTSQSSHDHVILHAGDPVSASFTHLTPATPHWYRTDGPVDDGVDLTRVDGARSFELVTAGQRQLILPVSQLSLRGAHNLENVAAAMSAASVTGVAPDTLAAVARSFRPLPNRLEPVGELDTISFVNDSYATAPAPTVAAIQSFTEPIVLVLGGQGKGGAIGPLVAAIQSSSVRAVVGYGREGGRFVHALRAVDTRPLKLRYESEFDHAVSVARSIAEPGDVVLLSPAATSYDQFRNAAERGDRFRTLVRRFEREAEVAP